MVWRELKSNKQDVGLLALPGGAKVYGFDCSERLYAMHNSEHPVSPSHAPLSNEPFSVVRVLCGVLTAVGELHGNFAYIHRDIKPDNILVDERGDGKLTDFGMCIKVQDASRPENVGDGTPAYCAPETSTPQGATVASEIYAVAVIFAEGLMNNCPFGSEVGGIDRSLLQAIPCCSTEGKTGQNGGPMSSLIVGGVAKDCLKA